MGHASGEGRSSIHPITFNSITDKNRATWIEKGSSSFGQPYIDRKSCPEKVVQSKSSENERKLRLSSKACNDDELVKHMSNLPGYLLRVEKENTVQEKALNFGVLDWKSLEKWRYNERMPSKYPKKSSCSSSNSNRPTNVPPKMIPNLRKQPTYHALNPSSLSSGKFPIPHDSSRFSSPKRQSAPSHQIYHMNSLKEEKTVGYRKEVKDGESTKLKGKEMYNQVLQAVRSSRSVNKQQNDLHQGVELYERSCSKTNMENNKIKDSKKELLSRIGPSSSEQEKPKNDILESTFLEKVTFNENMMSGCRKELISEKEPSSSEQLKHKVDLNFPDNVKSLGKKSETRFANEVNFASECCTSDLQNNLPLPNNFSRRSYSGSSQFSEYRPSVDGQPAEAITVNRFSDFFAPLDHYSGEFSTDIPHSCPLPFVGPAMPQSATTVPIEGGTINEKTSKVKGRPPSPTRRFGFNLGRMSRSFSFKESSVSPPLSSQYGTVKSSPIRNEISFDTENSEKDKGNSSGRGRSSPLRRLLDPILKYKPVETVRSKDRKPEGSTFQALLRLTLKNELPFFKLVVDNNSDMLAAAAKRSEKSDLCLNYAFYSIHEVKKKSMNWMSQRSKSKSSGLDCKTIGQMIISCSNQNAKECVLYGVDTQTPECVIPNKEIAAIIVNKPNEETSDVEETRNCNGMVVVLPGGVHGTPIKGAPSSLLSRWRSGGSCDCGGWDTGCKLQILCDDQQNANVLDAPIHVDRVNLFMQGKEKKVKPVLSLERLNNEFYSVEFDMSISLLEAFAACVSCVTCRDFSEFLDSNGTASCIESGVGTDKMKTPITALEAQIPAKYITRPPLSPAGRI